MTGGIGAGKSAAVDAFVRAGAVAFSADRAVHALYRTSDVRDAVVERWGEDVLAADGEVDRRRVAAIVFEDEAEREWLEQLLHPLVAREWLHFVDAHTAGQQAPEFIVAEVPLLFEAGLDDRYDATVLVTAPEQVRVQRTRERAGGADPTIRGRMAAQMPESEKARRADFVIDNRGSLDDLGRSVRRVMDDMRMHGVKARD